MNPACEAALGAKLPVAKRDEIGKHLLHLHDKRPLIFLAARPRKSHLSVY
jgi:hypothetical protein